MQGTIALGVAPELAAVLGLTGLQAIALAVVCLVVLAHGPGGHC